MQIKTCLCILFCLLLCGCASTSKRTSPDLAKVKIGTSGKLELRIGKPKPADKAPDEEKSDRYGEKDENPFLKEQSVGVTASWKF